MALTRPRILIAILTNGNCSNTNLVLLDETNSIDTLIAQSSGGVVMRNRDLMGDDHRLITGLSSETKKQGGLETDTMVATENSLGSDDQADNPDGLATLSYVSSRGFFFQ